jgi:hypothetical protein
MSEWSREEYTDELGATHLVLVQDGIEVELGVPLLELGALGLSDEMEAQLRKYLWAHGIKECTDALQPGAQSKIAAALRGALRFAVSNVVSLCEDQHNQLTEG